MGFHSKIDDKELETLIRQGMTTTEIAKYFNCSLGAVSQRKKKLQNGIIQAVTITKGEEVIDSHLNMVSELRNINQAINEELDRAKIEIEKPEADIKALQEIIVKLSAEIRKQLALQASFYQTWYKIEGYQAFQDEFLQMLEEVSPELRDELIARLRKRKVLRGLVQSN
ncbi:MAG: hypothetical protein JSV31_16325 [Desulfobacterales bacterium]|nr:MAG: hypothetical protein JSV31_16325 [Desulfobacterales bacterium]